ncbi:MAG: hypothetical protein R2818_05575 [Flavobacteriales bacterium]
MGTWTLTSGSGSIVDPNDPNTTVDDLVVGQSDFLWTIDNGACGSSSATQSVFIYDDNAPDSDAGPDQGCATRTPVPTSPRTRWCSQPQVVGQWSAGTGVFADVIDPNTNVSGLSLGTNTFRWTIDNGPCGTTTDEVTITLFDDQQPIADTGPDQELCTPTSTTTHREVR